MYTMDYSADYGLDEFLENVIESLNPLFNEKNIKLNQDIIDDEV